jgi:hypothetical protein
MDDSSGLLIDGHLPVYGLRLLTHNGAPQFAEELARH